jgi:hypothetical protein
VTTQQFTHCVNCGAEKVAGVECPLCGAIYERAERIWSKRHQSRAEPLQMAANNEDAARSIHSPEFSIDCTACKLQGGMERRRVNRFPIFIRMIGWIIATPSAVGMAVGIFVVFTNGGGGFGSDTMGLFVGGGFFMLSAVGGLVGWLLLMRKNAWVCSRCGYLMDRA